MVLFSLICFVSIIIDQVSKFFIERNLYGKSIDIIENIFSFTYLENKGAAWGIFSENSWILLILSPILIFIIGFFFFWPHCLARGILVPSPGIELVPPALEA